MPLADKATKAAANPGHERAVFRLFSRGVTTQRDEWVYAADLPSLARKAERLVATYEQARLDPAHPARDTIKWDRELENYRTRGIKKRFEAGAIRRAAFRPFVARWLYFDKHFNGMTYQLPAMLPPGRENVLIAFLGMASSNPLCALASADVVDLCYLKNGNGGTQAVSRWRYAPDGRRLDNVTDWGLRTFRERYPDEDPAITKDDVFAYAYAALHDPVWREAYAADLRRELPRVPLHPGFRRWAEWGESLLALHLGYESIEPWPLTRLDVPDETARVAGVAPRPILRAAREAGAIRLDAETTLTGVPPEAWTYVLGNRSAIEWVLDQHKERRLRDETLRAAFDGYHFADHKGHVIDLLGRVTRVSVETTAIVEALRHAERG